MKYLLRRLLRAAAVLAATSVLCFLLTAMAPGTFFDELRLNPQVSPETVAALRAQYGLDRPLVVRYGAWWKSALHGDWGYSLAYHAPVMSLLLPRAKNTLLLAGAATLLAWLIAVPIGVVSASKRGWLNHMVTAGTSLMLSLPEIAVVLAALTFAVRTHALPVGGLHSAGYAEMSTSAKLADIAAHLAIPCVVLALAIVAIVVRHIRASVGEILESSYIGAAKGLGIGKTRLLYRHALPVAANPAISLFGLSLASLLSSSLAVEVITGWPGLGPLVLEATLARDTYVIIGAVMLSALLVIGGTLIADVLLVVFDPRIGLGGSHA